MRPTGTPIPREDGLVLLNQSPPGTPTPTGIHGEELVRDPISTEANDPAVAVTDTDVTENAPDVPDDAGKSKKCYLPRREMCLTRNADPRNPSDSPEEAQTRSTWNPPQGGGPQAQGSVAVDPSSATR